MTGVKITGVGVAIPGYDSVPGRIVTNEMLAKELYERGLALAKEKGLCEAQEDEGEEKEREKNLADFMKDFTTSDAWIRERSFIERRSFADPTIATSDLAAIAIERALESAGLDRHKLERIDLATVSHDHIASPPTVAIIAKLLELNGICKKELGMLFGADTTVACSSFVAAFQNAYAAIASGVCRNSVVVGADVMSRMVNPNDRGFMVLLGDAAGALVLEACDSQGSSLGPRDLYFGMDGRFADRIIAQAGGTRMPNTPELTAAHRDKLWMDGKAVFKEIVNLIFSEKDPPSSVIGRALERSGKTLADIDLFAFHQANLRMIQLVELKLREAGFRGIVLNNIQNYANTTSATIPLVLAEAHRDGQLPCGKTFMAVVFGGGYTWGTIIAKWTAEDVAVL